MNKKKIMRKRKHIAPGVLQAILADYKDKLPDGSWKYKASEIAAKFEISAASITNIAKSANLKLRQRGGRKLRYPSPLHMAILKEAQQPGISMEEIGELHYHKVKVMKNGKPVKKNGKYEYEPRPLTRARVSQILQFWKGHTFSEAMTGRGFKVGDVIEIRGNKLTVVRYDNSKCGAVKTERGDVVDPFYWRHEGEVPTLVNGHRKKVIKAKCAPKASSSK